MSRVTGIVVSKPCITMPRESPTRMKSTSGSISAAVCAWYEVSDTIGAPPFLARISFAVRRWVSTAMDKVLLCLSNGCSV